MFEIITTLAKLAVLCGLLALAAGLGRTVFKTWAAWTLATQFAGALNKRAFAYGGAVGAALGLLAALLVPMHLAIWQVAGLMASTGLTVCAAQVLNAVVRLTHKDQLRFHVLTEFAANRIERGIYSAKFYT